MIDEEELLFIVDENNNPLEPKPRSFAHKKGFWHRTTGIWIFNSRGQVLCQKRSFKKDTKPGYWEAFFGGHLAVGEDYLQSAANEVNEELGLSVKPQDLIAYKVFKSDNPDHKEFQQVLFLNIDLDISKFDFEKEEIDKLKWVDLDKLRVILVEKKYASWVVKSWDEEIIDYLKGKKIP